MSDMKEFKTIASEKELALLEELAYEAPSSLVPDLKDLEVEWTLNHSNKELTVRQKRSLNAIKRCQKLIKREILGYEESYDKLREKEQCLQQDLPTLNVKNNQLKKEVYSIESKVQIESRNLVRKLKAIKTLENRFDLYKTTYTERIRKITSTIDDYIIELLREERELDRKLRRQFWRNKDGLRLEKAQVEDLRKKFSNISQNLSEELEFLERGYFTFGSKNKL